MAISVADLRRADQALSEHERQLSVITDAVPIFIARHDGTYRLRFVNKGYADRFGIRPEDTAGARVPDVVGEEAFAMLRQYVEAALQGQAGDVEVRIASARYGDRHVQLAGTAADGDDNSMQKMFAAVSDITHIRRTEEQLARREQEFQILVEHSPDLIIRLDRQLHLLYVNPAAGIVFGLGVDEGIGKARVELRLPDSVEQAWGDAVKEVFDSGSERRFAFEHQINGKLRHFSARIVPEQGSHGELDSVLGIVCDVSDRARMEQERDESITRERNARLHAEAAARARDEFLATVSHELRAPLNGIQSWTHVIENYVKDAVAAPLAQRALHGIKTGVEQQVRLIEDLLDVTRMMSGKLRLVKQALVLLPVVQAAVESIRSAAVSKQICVTSSYTITSEQIDGDADRVQQVIWNLLSNAIKFTPMHGNVWLSASPVDNGVLISIRDDGIGITPDFLPQLFDRFSQEDTSSTRRHSGLGLGLYLVRHLIDLHGGWVDAESAGEGAGATFSVFLPVRQRSGAYATDAHLEDSGGASTLPSLEGLRILLIDDQEDARESLSLVLSSAGATVFPAASSKEILNWLPTVAASELPDVLVCDIAMPDEDGYSVLKKIRAWKSDDGARSLQRLPALALTAFAQREDRIRALTAGFQMHVTKPVAPEELIVVISTMAPKNRTV